MPTTCTCRGGKHRAQADRGRLSMSTTIIAAGCFRVGRPRPTFGRERHVMPAPCTAEQADNRRRRRRATTDPRRGGLARLIDAGLPTLDVSRARLRPRQALGVLTDARLSAELAGAHRYHRRGYHMRQWRAHPLAGRCAADLTQDRQPSAPSAVRSGRRAIVEGTAQRIAARVPKGPLQLRRVALDSARGRSSFWGAPGGTVARSALPRIKLAN